MASGLTTPTLGEKIMAKGNNQKSNKEKKKPKKEAAKPASAVASTRSSAEVGGKKIS